MPDPLKPILKPAKPPQLKTGEEHITYGCLFLIAGGAAIAGVIYVFRDFFMNNALYSLIGIFVLWRLYDMASEKLKKKKENQQ